MIIRPRYYSYELITGAVVPVLSLSEIKMHLRIDTLDVTEDAYLESLEKAVVLFAEKYTKRDFINKTYKTYRDSFIYNSSYWPDLNVIELRRSKLQAVNSIYYYYNNILTLLPTSYYYIAYEYNFGFIALNNNQQWPNIDNRYNCIEIEFIAGYGDTAASIPDDLKNALLQHIARIYQNRGDCDQGSCGCAENFPTQESKRIYDLYRIDEISL